MGVVVVKDELMVVDGVVDGVGVDGPRVGIGGGPTDAGTYCF